MTSQLQAHLAEMIPQPDQYFWYVISLLALGATIFLLRKYMDKMERTMEKLVDHSIKTDNTLIELKTKQIDSDKRIHHLEESFSDKMADKIVSKIRSMTPK